MTCTHSRTASVHVKHDDRANLCVPHMNYDHVGYMPMVGIFGGDDTSFNVCLDCGQILNWIAISDKDLREDEDDEDDDGSYLAIDFC